jgi:hypothetical protein
MNHVMSPLLPFACQMGFYVLTAAQSGWPDCFRGNQSNRLRHTPASARRIG